MARLNPLRVLLVLALALPVLALWPQGQDEAKTDWGKEVDRAANATRYGMRVAAARKVAAAGPAAVPAIEAFAQKNGRNALPSALVEFIADQSTLEAPVWEQLIAWANDRDFYWRGQAMRGLALRAPRLPGIQKELGAVFAKHRDDPAWLMRTHARLGLALLGDETVTALPEDDPRARTRLTALLLTNGKLPPLQPLIDALACERTFLGTPWAQASAQQAHDALKAWLGDEHPLAIGGSFPDKETGIAQVVAAAGKKSGQPLTASPLVQDPEPAAAGGIELLSCKHGDLFLQWDDAGSLRAGIDGRTTVQVPKAAWDALTRERQALDLGGDLGVIVCDTLRLLWTPPAVHVKVAPGSLPAATTNWLQSLAQAIDAAGNPKLAETLRTGLTQFAPR